MARVRDELAFAEMQAAGRDSARAEQDRIVAELGAGLSQLVQGDVTCLIDGSYRVGQERFRHDLESTIGALGPLLAGILKDAARISQEAQEISPSCDDLLRRAESQATWTRAVPPRGA